MKILWIIPLTLMLLGCSKEPTQERAQDMFREPSSEKKGKIPDKFQPIDHKIDTNGQ